MKKFILSLFAALFLLALQVEAQIPCSSNFTTTFLSSSNVKFIPTVQYSAPTTYHVWTFGDGTPDSTTVSPTHNYTSPGTYVVKHKIQISSNGTNIFCNDSTLQTITISAPCTLQASFTSSPVASNPLTIIFQSTSIGAAPGDSILWTFGDGTATQSSSLNTSHTYASPGTYNACLRIVKMLPNGGGVSNCISDICHPVVIPTSTTCQVQANFNLVPTAGTTNPLLQYFANTSINIVATDSIRWTFGDGASASTFNASHTYANYGVYNVCLRVIKRNPNGVLIPTCVSEYCRLDTIVAPTPQCSVQAAFNIVPTTGLNPLVQYFANTSTNIVATDSIRWTFGDGSGASTFNASHTYANYGVYNVCLRVIKRNPNGVLLPTCVSEYCRLDTIAGPSCTVQALFINASIPPPANQLIQSFLNTTVGLTTTDSIRWTFGDGTSASSINVTHTYATYGTYNVCLRVIKRINGVLQPNCVSEYCKLDTITAPVYSCNAQPYFTNNVDSAFAPAVILFSNQSTGVSGVSSLLWNFGDGTTTTVSNPAHTFTTPGYYTVCLTITVQSPVAGNAPCVRQYCKVNSILVTPAPTCNVTANFSIIPNTTSPFTHSYLNTSLNALPTDSIRWTFGDGTSSNVYSPTHTYANTGFYNVCLRIIKRNAAGTLQTNCIREYCKWDSIVVPNTCNIQAYFSATFNSTTAPAVAQFTNQTVGILPTDIVTWTFGDGSTGTGANPTHTYANAGTYIACIRIVRQTVAGTTPCVREYCKTFIITAPATTCNISANYTWYRDSAVTIPNLYHFINTTVGFSSTDSIRWSFGDGTFSNAVNPNHSYAQTGPYQVCLRVIKRNAAGVLLPNCVSEKCYTVVVASPTGINCANVTLTYTTTTDPLYINRKTFTAVSNSQILNQTWTITRITQAVGGGIVTINQFNPTYAFLDSGSYRVCLKAIFANNCVKEYCTTITIAMPTPTTSLCNLNLYPNPASTVVTGKITLSQPLILYAFIYNAQNMLVAQKIQQGAVGLNNVPVNIANLPAGIYRYRLYYGFQACVSTFFKQ